MKFYLIQYKQHPPVYLMLHWGLFLLLLWTVCAIRTCNIDDEHGPFSQENTDELFPESNFMDFESVVQNTSASRTPITDLFNNSGIHHDDYDKILVSLLNDNELTLFTNLLIYLLGESKVLIPFLADKLNNLRYPTDEAILHNHSHHKRLSSLNQKLFHFANTLKLNRKCDSYPDLRNPDTKLSFEQGEMAIQYDINEPTEPLNECSRVSSLPLYDKMRKPRSGSSNLIQESSQGSVLSLYTPVSAKCWSNGSVNRRCGLTKNNLRSLYVKKWESLPELSYDATYPFHKRPRSLSAPALYVFKKKTPYQSSLMRSSQLLRYSTRNNLSSSGIFSNENSRIPSPSSGKFRNGISHHTNPNATGFFKPHLYSGLSYPGSRKISYPSITHNYFIIPDEETIHQSHLDPLLGGVSRSPSFLSGHEIDRCNNGEYITGGLNAKAQTFSNSHHYQFDKSTRQQCLSTIPLSARQSTPLYARPVDSSEDPFQTFLKNQTGKISSRSKIYSSMLARKRVNNLHYTDISDSNSSDSELPPKMPLFTPKVYDFQAKFPRRLKMPSSVENSTQFLQQRTRQDDLTHIPDLTPINPCDDSTETHMSNTDGPKSKDINGCQTNSSNSKLNDTITRSDEPFIRKKERKHNLETTRNLKEKLSHIKSLFSSKRRKQTKRDSN